MPLIARDANTGDRFDMTEIDNPRQALAGRDLVCQLCAMPMMVKAGQIRINHFAHYATCTSPYATEVHGETIAHLKSKQYGKAWLQAQADFFGATLVLECPIPSLKRIADVMAIWPDGRQFALEIQLSSITVERLAQRTADYRELDIPVLWWLGQSGETPATRQWCAMHCPEYGQVSFSEDEPSVRRIMQTERPFAVRIFRQYSASPFLPCPTCGLLVIVRTWTDEQGWTRLAIPLTAALGLEHRHEEVADALTP